MLERSLLIHRQFCFLSGICKTRLNPLNFLSKSTAATQYAALMQAGEVIMAANHSDLLKILKWDESLRIAPFLFYHLSICTSRYHTVQRPCVAGHAVESTAAVSTSAIQCA